MNTSNICFCGEIRKILSNSNEYSPHIFLVTNQKKILLKYVCKKNYNTF